MDHTYKNPVTLTQIDETNLTENANLDRGSESASRLTITDSFDMHPLLRDAAIFPTRAVEEFVNAVKGWLDNLLPGAFVWGHPRIGKTQAIKYLRMNCRGLLGSPIPTAMMSCGESTVSATTENRFFGEMLRVLGYGLTGSGTAALKRHRVIAYMVERVREAREHRFLLFVDEAQWMSAAHFRFLMDLHNQLKLEEVRLVTVLVGTPELLKIKQDLRSAGENHLLGRFMAGSHHFRGAVGLPDFRRLLRALDQGCEYPENSGVSYTRFFLPKAFGAGWRLVKQTDRIWRQLHLAFRRENIPKTKELPMQALTALIRWLLEALSHLDDPTLELEDKLIDESIYRVALTQLEDHAYQTASKTRR